jgi:acetyl esterase/lipase
LFQNKDEGLIIFAMRQIAILFSTIFLLASCGRDALTPDPVTNPAQPLVYADLAYGTQALQKMDVFLPGGRTATTTKTLVVIHGGAWIEGDKSEMTYVVDSLKKRLPTWAFINMNYRLALNGNTSTFPAQETDVKTAIESYLAKSATYLVSKDIVILGASAGAHLALLHGYKNDPDKHVKAIVDFYGPTDLVAMWNEGFIIQLGLILATGKSYTQDPTLYTQSSPINFIGAQSPPTIVLHGGRDDLVNPSQSNMLIDKLNLKGVSNQLVYYPNEGHGFTTANDIDGMLKSLAFIAKYVK